MAKITRQKFPDIEEIKTKPSVIDNAIDDTKPITTETSKKAVYPKKQLATDKNGVVTDAASIKLLLDFYQINAQKVWVVKDWKNQWKVIDLKGNKYYFPKDEPVSAMKVQI